MRKTFMTFALLLSAMTMAGEGRVQLCDGWRFMLGDDQSAAQTTFDDSKWERVTVPHDWSIWQQPSEKATPGNEGGYYEAGIGWYRMVISPKALNRMACLEASKYWLCFDGVYQKATVYVNGKEAGRHDYGYTPFDID